MFTMTKKHQNGQPSTLTEAEEDKIFMEIMRKQAKAAKLRKTLAGIPSTDWPTRKKEES